ncbi:unnamed protein product [Choristocarpus tenellus]
MVKGISMPRPLSFRGKRPSAEVTKESLSTAISSPLSVSPPSSPRLAPGFKMGLPAPPPFVVPPFASKLIASLVTVGWEMLTGDALGKKNEEMLAWGGEIISKVTDRPRPAPEGEGMVALNLSKIGGQPESGSLVSNSGEGTEEMKDEREGREVSSTFDVKAVTRDFEANQETNRNFFEEFLQGLQGGQSSPLDGVGIALNDYEVCEGDVAFLQAAYDSGMKAFAASTNNMDTRLKGALIAVSTGYIRRSKIESPAKAKDFLVRGTLKSIIRSLSPLWLDESTANNSEGREVFLHLLDLISCVHLLPPKSVDVLPRVDARLLPALGLFCAGDRESSWRYPEDWSLQAR